MNVKRSVFAPHVLAFVTVASLFISEHGPGLAWAQSTRSYRNNDEMVELARGPIHEAYAKLVSLDPRPGIVVSARPPEPIQELPPEQWLEGAIWIPGYWAWTDDEGFIWNSGVWRVPPPGAKDWIPGYWEELDEGHRWISGYWTVDEIEPDTVYLPDPPKSLDKGPNLPPPGNGFFWVPGTWRWIDERYVWQAGYWREIQTHWVWVPSHYVWTPYGCVFVNGFWDYPLENRGLVFAPVWFRSPIYRGAAFSYVPRVVVNVALLTRYLFARPGYSHYYFGDWYDARYYDRGVYPWYAYHRQYSYDPTFAYYSAISPSGGSGWYDTQRRRYATLRDNADARPKRLFRDIERLARGGAAASRSNLVLARTLRDLADDNLAAIDGQARLVTIDQAARDEIREEVRDWRHLASQRAIHETRGRAAGYRGSQREPKFLPHPTSPFTRRQSDEDRLSQPRFPAPRDGVQRDDGDARRADARRADVRRAEARRAEARREEARREEERREEARRNQRSYEDRAARDRAQRNRERYRAADARNDRSDRGRAADTTESIETRPESPPEAATRGRRSTDAADEPRPSARGGRGRQRQREAEADQGRESRRGRRPEQPSSQLPVQIPEAIETPSEAALSEEGPSETARTEVGEINVPDPGPDPAAGKDSKQDLKRDKKGRKKDKDLESD